MTHSVPATAMSDRQFPTASPGMRAGRRRSPRTVFLIVILLLFTSGWATNHFATMVAVLRDQEDYSPIVVNGAFGIYAVGMVPCLLLGGLLADRFGARRVVLTGATLAAAGNVILLLLQSTSGLFVGRFVIGLGVGLAMSAGTAWAGKLRGASGVVLAGIVLSAGFAIGPIASGLVAYMLPGAAAVSVPFIISIAVSVGAVALGLVVGQQPPEPPQPSGPAVTVVQSDIGHKSVRRALATSIPMALWVFSTAAIALITLTSRIGPQLDVGVLLPGLAALVSFTAALLLQSLGRRFHWGHAGGVVAALIAAAGLVLTGLGGPTPALWLFFVASLLLGAAYGMCLRDGLLDVEAYAPPTRRGITLGIFYVFTYLGFALPVVLEWLRPVTGDTTPLIILAGAAVSCAAIRAIQIRTGVLDRA